MEIEIDRFEGQRDAKIKVGPKHTGWSKQEMLKDVEGFKN